MLMFCMDKTRKLALFGEGMRSHAPPEMGRLEHTDGRQTF